jgi:hypothetical protein
MKNVGPYSRKQVRRDRGDGGTKEKVDLIR